VMHGGRIVATGEPVEIQHRLTDLYFGGAA
jgi:hypothetical protein